jgi:hypothetical protein
MILIMYDINLFRIQITVDFEQLEKSYWIL